MREFRCFNHSEAERQNAAIEFSFSRPFDGAWGMDLSYTWAHNWGNHEGYVQSDIGQNDAGVTQNFDQPGLTDYAYGNLPNDRRHTIKAWCRGIPGVSGPCYLQPMRSA